MDHLHPESMRQLRQLAKLHGVPALQRALREVEEQIKRENATLAVSLKKLDTPTSSWV